MAPAPGRRGTLGGALRCGLPPGGRRGARCSRLPWCAALLGPAQAGLTPFSADPAQEGCARFQQDAFIAERYLERDDGACSSIRGPQCRGLHGRPRGPAPGGVFSLFGTLPGDPGFFVQDEAGPYFMSSVREEVQDARGAQEQEPPEGELGAAASSAAAAAAAPAARAPAGSGSARSSRLSFGGLPPQLERLPRWLNLTSSLAVEAVGSFALLPAPLAGVFNTSAVDGLRPRVLAEVQDAVAYLRFSQLVVVDHLLLARGDEPSKGEKALPIVLRGRNGPDEQWSSYLRHGDLRPGRVTPFVVSPLPVNEVVMMGGRGLLIASIRVSRLPSRRGDPDDSQGSDAGAEPAEPAASAAAAPARNGWLLAPAHRKLRSLHDVTVGRLALPSAAPVLSVAEIHRMGYFRLRADLFEDEQLELALAAADPAAPSGQQAAAQGAGAEQREFVDARTVGGARALIDALVTGALALPPDLSLKQLDEDSRLYGETFGQVTLEEAANARGLDELYERLFTANRMDELDLLFLHFLWANHTGALRSPGGIVPDRPLRDGRAAAAGGAAAPEAETVVDAAVAAVGEENRSLPVAAGKPAVLAAAAAGDLAEVGNATEVGAVQAEVGNATEVEAVQASVVQSQDADGKMLRGIISRLRRFTSIYARWKKPIEEKIALLNASGAGDVTFTLYQNRSWLGVDYYNAASGRSRRLDLDVPDAEYLLAELLAVEDELLVDRTGRPLPQARANRVHAEKSYLREFEAVLLELRRSTSDVEEDLEQEGAEGDSAAETDANESESSDGTGPRRLAGAGFEASAAPSLALSLAVALGVPCLVVASVLALAFAPPLPPPGPGRPPLAARWAGQVLDWLHCANAALERLEARLGFAARPDVAPAPAPRRPERAPAPAA